jgi:hypothetical protein
LFNKDSEIEVDLDHSSPLKVNIIHLWLARMQRTMKEPIQELEKLQEAEVKVIIVKLVNKK